MALTKQLSPIYTAGPLVGWSHWFLVCWWVHRHLPEQVNLCRGVEETGSGLIEQGWVKCEGMPRVVMGVWKWADQGQKGDAGHCVAWLSEWCKLAPAIALAQVWVAHSSCLSLPQGKSPYTPGPPANPTGCSRSCTVSPCSDLGWIGLWEYVA